MKNTGYNIFTVTQIANQAKYTLERNYENIWIQGEISSCKPYSSGHIYLTLKDEKSELSAVIFSQHVQQLSKLPQFGQKVTVNGNLSLYATKGKFQLQIRNIYSSGQGELWLAYEALKQKLEAEGLFDSENKKSICRFPKCVGIITSIEGAALKDIIQVLERRSPHLSCLIYPVPVQGKNAGKIISNAIVNMNKYGNIDTLILARGGGSLEDLWCFNDEKVVRTIYASEIPIISAVGHETDTTLSDYVADLRAPTPSAAAELVSDDRLETIQLLDYYSGKFNQLIFQKIVVYNEKLNSYQKRHGFFMPHLMINQMNEKINQIFIRFKKSGLNQLQKIQVSLMSKSENFQLLDPRLQFNRGFSITTNERREIILSPSQIELDDIINVKVAHGSITAKVIEKREENV